MYFSHTSLGVLFALVWLPCALSDQLDIDFTAPHSYSVQPRPVPARLLRYHNYHARLRKSSSRDPSVTRRAEKSERPKSHVNVGISGHVDHGKTTLTTGILHAISPHGGVKAYDTIDHSPIEKVRDISISTSHKTKSKRWIRGDVRAATNLRKQSSKFRNHFELSQALSKPTIHPWGFPLPINNERGFQFLSPSTHHGGHDTIDHAPEEK